MDENTFARLLEWIPEVWRVNAIGVNVVNFLGGEPLLRTDRIKKIMDVVRRQTDGIHGLVNTNGDLVDAVAWDDLEHIRWITVREISQYDFCPADEEILKRLSALC